MVTIDQNRSELKLKLQTCSASDAGTIMALCDYSHTVDLQNVQLNVAAQLREPYALASALRL